MSEESVFTVTLRNLDRLEFEVGFDWEGVPEIVMDEPEPIGGRKGPNASRLLAAAVGNCLAASLLFCLRKSKAPARGLEAQVTGRLERNERGRLRIGGLEVEIRLPTSGLDPNRLRRCLDLFEDYCLVTQSIRNGIPVGVRVVDAGGDPIPA